jgi:hypothetical protein
MSSKKSLNNIAVTTDSDGFMMSPQKYSQILAGGLLIYILAACGGGGGGSSSPQPSSEAAITANGILLDAPVEGARHVSGSVRGITDANGTFQYEIGNSVRFYVGDILLGEAVGKPMITPVDFINGADINNDTVTNIARFLQTIDEDENPDNGIQISQIVRDLAKNRSVNFSQSPAAFDSDGNVQIIIGELTAATVAGARPLVSSTIAQNHLSQSIWNYYAGSYEGTFTGDDSGSFNASITTNGAITGTGNSNNLGAFSIFGSLGTDGSFTLAAGGTNRGATYSGTITADKMIAGTWDNGGGSNGTFSGEFSSSPPITDPPENTQPPIAIEAPIGSQPPIGGFR